MNRKKEKEIKHGSLQLPTVCIKCQLMTLRIPRLTCLEVGDDGAAGERALGGVQGHGVGGAGPEAGQLVVLPVALNQDGVCGHWGRTHTQRVWVSLPLHMYHETFFYLAIFFVPSVKRIIIGVNAKQF